MHEMGHASAAWLTGGKVDKIEVWQNEGGVTNFRNGWKGRQDRGLAKRGRRNKF